MEQRNSFQVHLLCSNIEYRSTAAPGVWRWPATSRVSQVGACSGNSSARYVLFHPPSYIVLPVEDVFWCPCWGRPWSGGGECRCCSPTWRSSCSPLAMPSAPRLLCHWHGGSSPLTGKLVHHRYLQTLNQPSVEGDNSDVAGGSGWDTRWGRFGQYKLSSQFDLDMQKTMLGRCWVALKFTLPSRCHSCFLDKLAKNSAPPDYD